MRSTCSASQEGLKVKLMKPGLAVQTRWKAPSGGILPASLSAIDIGFIRICLESLSGRLHEKSPCSGLLGRSIAGSSTWAWGRSPLAWASPKARRTMPAMFSRIGVVIGSDSEADYSRCPGPSVPPSAAGPRSPSENGGRAAWRAVLTGYVDKRALTQVLTVDNLTHYRTGRDAGGLQLG